MILHIFFLWSLQLQGGKRKHQCSDDPCGNSDVQPYIKYSRSLSNKIHAQKWSTIYYCIRLSIEIYIYIAERKKCSPRRVKFGLEGRQRKR